MSRFNPHFTLTNVVQISPDFWEWFIFFEDFYLLLELSDLIS